jgi:hypothetical protein
METDRHIWRVWASILQRWGVDGLAASFLEVAGPLTVFGAQIVYIAQPMIGQAAPQAHLDELARLLEDSQRTREFVSYLREASTA